MHDLIHESQVSKAQSSVTKLELLLESIEEVSKVNDTITIKFKDNVVIASKKSIVLFAVDYLHLDAITTLSLNLIVIVSFTLLTSSIDSRSNSNLVTDD
jgi:hypothetical protein